MSYQHGDIDIGDYLEIALCDGQYKVTDFDDEHIDLVDSFGSSTGCDYQDVKSVTLPSEMPYAF